MINTIQKVAPGSPMGCREVKFPRLCHPQFGEPERNEDALYRLFTLLFRLMTKDWIAFVK